LVASACRTESGHLGNTKSFQNLLLDFFAGGIDGLHSAGPGTNAVPELPLSRGTLDDLRNRVGNFLRIALRGADPCGDRLRDLIHRTVGALPRPVRAAFESSENSRWISARLHDNGIDPLRSEFIPVGLGERFQREFACGVEAHAREHDAPSAATDVEQKAAAFLPHVRKNRAVHAYDPEEICVEDALRLFGGE
jgi:hypothetical protein